MRRRILGKRNPYAAALHPGPDLVANPATAILAALGRTASLGIGGRSLPGSGQAGGKLQTLTAVFK
jgi:hypothetical protein